LKKFLTLFCTFLACYAIGSTPIQAEKYDWVDSSYSFKTVKTAYVYDIDCTPAQIDSNVIVKVLQNDYLKHAVKPPYKLIPADQIMATLPTKPQPVPASTSAAPTQAAAVLQPTNEAVPPPEAAVMTPATETTAKTSAITDEEFLKAMVSQVDIYIEASLLEYSHGSYVIPAHTDWRTEDRTDSFVDREGRVQTVVHPITYPVYVPDETVPTVGIKVRFNVYDAKTGNEIMSREESRYRGRSDDPRSMYNRAVESFFNDLKKKIKK